MVKILANIRKSADERKKQILDEALELFSNDSYSSIVMDDIAKVCNIARTTLYEYFSNKEDILIALVERVASEAREIKLHGSSCKECLEFLAEDLINTIQKNKVTYRILFQATPVLSEKLSSKLNDWKKQNFQQVYEVANMGKNSGEIRKCISTNDVTFAYQAFIGQRTGEIIMNNEDVNPKAESKRLVNMFWYGIGENI